MSKDCIVVKNINVVCIIGIDDHERHNPQKISVDLELYLPLAKAAKSGKMSDTVDYSVLVRQIRKMLLEERYLLLESAVESIAKYVMTHKKIQKAAVTITKSQVFEDGTVPSIRIVRKR